MLVSNPHLRAKFAQLLALMIPRDEEEESPRNSWVGLLFHHSTTFFSLFSLSLSLSLSLAFASFRTLSEHCLNLTI